MTPAEQTTRRAFAERHGEAGEEHLYAALQAFSRNDRETEKRHQKAAYRHFQAMEHHLRKIREAQENQP